MDLLLSYPTSQFLIPNPPYQITVSSLQPKRQTTTSASVLNNTPQFSSLFLSTLSMASPLQESSFMKQVFHAKKELDKSTGTPLDSVPTSPGLSSDSSRASVTSLATPSSPIDSSSVTDSFVFAFDIDGVLVRGGKPIPEAIKAMQVLNGDNEYGIHV